MKSDNAIRNGTSIFVGIIVAIAAFARGALLLPLLLVACSVWAKLFKFMKQQGFIGEGQYIKSCVIRSGSALAPNWLRKFMFERVLRK